MELSNALVQYLCLCLQMSRCSQDVFFLLTFDMSGEQRGRASVTFLLEMFINSQIWNGTASSLCPNGPTCNVKSQASKLLNTIYTNC